MREQLIQYVELLFAGAGDSEDVKQEILQNTLDRYDDLIAEGKVPEAAYRLAITGIGDISEILGVRPQLSSPGYVHSTPKQTRDMDTPGKKLMRAVAVGLYIISFMPLFILSELGMSTIGFCGTLTIVAVATVLMMLGAKKKSAEDSWEETPCQNPVEELKKSINGVIWAIGLAVYFVFSFMTGAWHISWVIFPIIGAVQGLVRAIVDLKEAMKDEN